MIDEDIKELILKRLESMPEHLEINLGELGTLQKADLIKHVKDEDSFGEKIAEIHMKYLRSFK